MFLQTKKALSTIREPVPLATIESLARHYFPYPAFNAGQLEAIVEGVDALVNKKMKHIIIEAPTGVGKSHIGLTIHQVIRSLVIANDPMGQWRTSISTPTKGLQDQYAKEDHVKLAILKGKKNYRCHVHSDIYYNSVQCRIQCRDGNCSPKRCPYVQARNHWTKMSDLRCTNSAMLVEMCSSLCMEPENRSDFIILDECHKMPQALLDHTIMEYDLKTLAGLKGIPNGDEMVKLMTTVIQMTKDYELGKLYRLPEELVNIFDDMHTVVEATVEILDEMITSDSLTDVQVMRLGDIIDILHNLSDYCSIMADTDAHTFIVHEKGDGQILFKAVLAADVSEFGVLRKADYFLHMSATICGIDSYARDMGIKKGEYQAITVGNPIPVENRKINYIPVMKMNNNMGDYEMKQFVKSVDEIIDFEGDVNGIIHTVSYDRAEAIQKFSKHRQKIVVPRTRDALLGYQNDAAKQGRKVIIASPAMEEGYDFKGDISRFQIIIKVPYAYLGDPLIAHVNQVDPSAYFREAVLRIVQMCGRSVRGVDDWANTYILDRSFENLLSRNPEFFPAWFTEAIFES